MNNKFKTKILLGFLVIGGLFFKVSDLSASYAMKRNRDIYTSKVWGSVPYQAFNHGDEGVAVETALRDEWFKLLECDADLLLEEFLAVRGRQCVNWVDREGIPSLHYVALRGRKQAVEWLLKNGADVDSRDSLGRTPLMCASEHIDFGRYGVVKLLLDYGANVNLQDAQGNTAFHRVCATGIWRDLIREFTLRGVDWNLRDSHGRTPNNILSETQRRAAEEWERLGTDADDEGDMAD